MCSDFDHFCRAPACDSGCLHDLRNGIRLYVKKASTFSVTYDVTLRLVSRPRRRARSSLVGRAIPSTDCRPRAALPPCAATAPTSLRLTAAIMKEQNAVLAAAGARMAGTPVRTSTAAAAGNCSPSGARLPASSRIAPRPRQGQPGEGLFLDAQVHLSEGR